MEALISFRLRKVLRARRSFPSWLRVCLPSAPRVFIFPPKIQTNHTTMKKNTIASAILTTLLCSLAFTPATSRATIVASTLSGDVDFNNQVDVSNWLAQQFTMGSISMSLDSVRTSFTFFDPAEDGTIATGDFRLSLYSDASGKPGTELIILNGPANPDGTTTYTYTPSTSFQLTASTKYWIVEKVTSGTGVYWADMQFDSSPDDVGIIGVSRLSDNGGVTWAAGETDPLIFEVNASPVPEPSILALAALGGGVLHLRRRMGKKARVA